jgi:hypothetical protein
MKATACDAQHLVEEYEALRRGATARAAGTSVGHGLALFLARGMYSWLDALTALTPASDRERPRLPVSRDSVSITCPAWTDLTTVLATMVLACTEGAEVNREPAS